MPAPIYIVNLSNAATPSSERPPLEVALTGYARYSIAQLPSSEAPAIVYLVGHALPDVLFDGDQQIDEVKLAETLRARRRGLRTLVVGDLCYAETLFDKINAADPENWVYIPSCAEYELSWHAGAEGNNETLFSRAFADAIREPRRSWTDLQSFLQARMRPIQTPKVLPTSPKIDIRDFFYPPIASVNSGGPSSGVGDVVMQARGR